MSSDAYLGLPLSAIESFADDRVPSRFSCPCSQALPRWRPDDQAQMSRFRL
jgi:hypothetical protein